MEILVTGGSGFLGQHLSRALVESGHRVRVMGRDFERAGMRSLFDEGAVPVRADLRDRRAVRSACEGVEVVYHVGALSAPWGNRHDFFSINVGGTRAVIEGCRASGGVRRLLYVSSPSVVFDGRDHVNLTEVAPYPRRFTSVYSLTKKLGEDQVNAATDLDTVILRPKAMFGPGDQSLLPRLITAARRGRLPQIGNGRNRVDLTYVGNVVHALVLAMDAPAARGNTYTITNDEHIPLWKVMRATLERLGLPSKLRTVPLPVALAAAGLMEALAAVTRKEPTLTRYSAAILARTQTYDISAAKCDLGYSPPVTFAEGMERTLASWQDTAHV